MTVSATLRRLTATALLAAAGGASADTTVNGTVGGGYARTDASALGDHSSSTTWDWLASLAASGSALRPGLLDWQLSGDYHGFRDVFTDGGASTRFSGTNLDYSANLSLLSDSVLPTTFFASQNHVDFTSAGAAASTGVTTNNSEGGSMTLNAQGLPTVRAAVSRLDAQNEGFGVAPWNAATTNLSVGAGQALRGFQYDVGYNTNWNAGTYADSNYRDHLFTLNTTSSFGDDLQMLLGDSYYLRQPTVQSPIDPRYDDNQFNATVYYKPTAVVSATGYTYHHFLADFFQAPSREITQQGLNNYTEYHYLPTVWLIGGGGFNYAADRLGDFTVRSTGEQASAGLRWTSPFSGGTLSLTGLGSAGFLQPSTGGNQLAWGLSAGGSFDRAWEDTSLQLAYNAAYQNNLQAQAGWTLSQTLTGNLQTRLSRGVRLRALLTANGTRQDLQPIGGGASRTLTAAVGATWRQLDGMVTAGATDGLATALGGPGLTDGLFLPASFNTHAQYVTLQATAGLATGLQAIGRARTLWTSGPGQPTETEQDLELDVNYLLGLFTVTLTDVYSVGNAAGLSRTGNVLLVRVSRSFGARF